MADPVRIAGLAGALIAVGGLATALGSYALLSTALCPPFTPGTALGGCVPVDLVPANGLALMATITVAGVATVAVGFLLYRRAKTRSAPPASASP